MILFLIPVTFPSVSAFVCDKLTLGLHVATEGDDERATSDVARKWWWERERSIKVLSGSTRRLWPIARRWNPVYKTVVHITRKALIRFICHILPRHIYLWFRFHTSNNNWIPPGTNSSPLLSGPAGIVIKSTAVSVLSPSTIPP